MPWVQNERVAAWTPARLYASSVGALYEQLHLPLHAAPTIAVMLPSCWMSRQPIRALLTAIWARALPAPPSSARAKAPATTAVADLRHSDSNAPGISPPRERLWNASDHPRMACAAGSIRLAAQGRATTAVHLTQCVPGVQNDTLAAMIRDRRAILALLTALNFLNFIDRAVIAAVLTPMKAELGLTNFEAGLLNTAFLIGYFATCPLFGARADKAARKQLITIGVIVWSAATVASGLATGFWTLLAARIVVGVGEASYAVLAPTIIDDLTPLERKGSALSVFYIAIPLGYALGYILGGQLREHCGWRNAFLVVGGPGLVLALSVLFIAEPPRKLLDAKAKLMDGLRELAQIPLFRRAVLGYCAYTAAVAGFSYWAVDFMLRAFPGELTLASANRTFGLVLIASGTIGTLIGGRFASGPSGSQQVAPDEPYDSLGNKLAVNSLLKVAAIAM